MSQSSRKKKPFPRPALPLIRSTPRFPKPGHPSPSQSTPGPNRPLKPLLALERSLVGQIRHDTELSAAAGPLSHARQPQRSPVRLGAGIASRSPPLNLGAPITIAQCFFVSSTRSPSIFPCWAAIGSCFDRQLFDCQQPFSSLFWHAMLLIVCSSFFVVACTG